MAQDTSAPPRPAPSMGNLSRFALCTLGGTFLFLSFPPFNLWYLAYFSLIPLMLAIRDRGPRAAFGWGLLAGTVTNFGGFHWISEMLQNFAGLPLYIALPICLVLCLYQGLIFALWSGISRGIRTRWPTLPSWLVSISVFLSLEFVFPLIFPWYLANSQHLFYPAVQIADVLGVLGVSLGVLLVNLVLFEGIKWVSHWRSGLEARPADLSPRFMLVAVLLTAANFGYGVTRIDQIDAEMAAAETIKIGLVEANIGMKEKRENDRFEANNLTHHQLSRDLESQGVELIIWPETSYQSRQIWGSTEKSEDRLFLELDSLFEPEFRDEVLPAIRALEVAFGEEVRRVPYFDHVLFRFRDHDWVMPNPKTGRMKPSPNGVLVRLGHGAWRQPFSSVPPQDVTFLLPDHSPLTQGPTRACKANSDCEGSNEICSTLNKICVMKSKTPWGRQAIRRDFDTPMIFGGLTLGPKNKDQKLTYDELLDTPRFERGLFNVALFMDRKGLIKGQYKKNYLLAGGEFMPFGEQFPWLYEMFPMAGAFTAGEETGLFEFKGARLGVMICYEDILPAFVREIAQKKPQILINVTNDAWFGKTSEPYLHLALATLRAVETRTWLIRSTNTGVSAFVDANGRIISQTSTEGAEILAEDVPIMPGKGTVYGKIGDVLGWLSLALMIGFYLGSRFRTQSRAKKNPKQRA